MKLSGCEPGHEPASVDVGMRDDVDGDGGEGCRRERVVVEEEEEEEDGRVGHEDGG